MSRFQMVSLQSGSNGNCIFVETNGIRLLFDAGLTGTRTQERLEQIGVDIGSIHGVLVSHAHWDHISGAGVLNRKFGLPIWLSLGTYQSISNSKKSLGRITSPNVFRAGARINFNDKVAVETIATTHDTPEGVCFVVDNGEKRVGIMTDLGCCFCGLAESISTLDAVLLESNYDEEMLRNGGYSAELKQRIRSDKGHLSNVDSAQLVHVAGKKLRWACLGHISQENNLPQIALDTHRHLLGPHFELHSASRFNVTELPSV
ncbi:MAG: MBL fold metallo-hydrolase [Thermoguttaceae bacterium]